MKRQSSNEKSATIKVREAFRHLIQTCDGETKQKARYLDLQLAAILSDLESLELCNDFVRDYPTHGFSDDVLMFKSSIYLDHAKKDEALKTLDELIDKFPHGDMIEAALFKKAMFLAEQNQTNAALATLLKLKEKAQASSITETQAIYWINRLKIFPK